MSYFRPGTPVAGMLSLPPVFLRTGVRFLFYHYRPRPLTAISDRLRKTTRMVGPTDGNPVRCATSTLSIRIVASAGCTSGRPGNPRSHGIQPAPRVPPGQSKDGRR